MAELVASDPSLTSNNAPQSTLNAEFTGFLEYKPPLDEVTLELKYEISYSLSEIIDTFRAMVFDDYQVLPEALRDSVRFKKRHCTFSEKSQTNAEEFKGNEQLNLCEVLKFNVTLLPLIPGFDAKEYEKKMKQKQEEESKKSESEKAAASGWGSWTSLSSWKDWGTSMLDTDAWSSSISSWMQYFNMTMEAKEIWKIDWTQHKATSFVQNITGSWTVGVYEYAEMEQLMHVNDAPDSGDDDDSNEKKTDDDNDDLTEVKTDNDLTEKKTDDDNGDLTGKKTDDDLTEKKSDDDNDDLTGKKTDDDLTEKKCADDNDDSTEKTTADDNDNKVKVIFTKKLYVHPIVPMPQFALDLLKDQYEKDSQTQVQLIKMLCEKPLTRTEETLQTMDDV